MKKGDAALIVLMVAACCFSSHVTADDDDIIAGFSRQPFTGTSCFGDDVKGDMVAMLSARVWEEIGATCGKKLRVICFGPVTPTTSVKKACNTSSSSYVDVIVVDRCEPCDDGTIKLSKKAFDEIANEESGIVKVQYVWAP